MLELDRIHKPRKPTDVRDKKQAPVLHGCCPHVRHTSNVYVEGLPALPSAIHYSIFPMPPEVVGDHGPPRVRAPHKPRHHFRYIYGEVIGSGLSYMTLTSS